MKDSYYGIKVIENIGSNKHRQTMCKCLCVCGREFTTRLGALKSGNTKSCGCRKSGLISKARYKHGRNQKDPTYGSWRAMKERCKARENYREIVICPEWEKDFNAFLRDMGERPKGLTLDRIDNKKGYFKENCRWATAAEQACNTSRNRPISFGGKTMLISHWERYLGLNSGVISKRIKRGWPLEKALTNNRQDQGSEIR